MEREIKKGDMVRVKYEYLESYNLKHKKKMKQKPYVVKGIIEDLKGNKWYKVSTFREPLTKEDIFLIKM